MLWTILVVLGILWLLGFSLHVGGSLIHSPLASQGLAAAKSTLV